MGKNLNLAAIMEQFSIDSGALPYGNGHINDTFVITSHPKYILQRINTDIFKSPEELMENIEKVTVAIKKKLVEKGEDPARGTLTIVKTKDGKNFYRDGNGNCYRVFLFIDDAVSYDRVESEKILYGAAKSFGEFQRMLSDFDASELHETIPDFHNTPKRFENLKAAFAADRANRRESVKEEIDFALSFEKEISKVVDGLADGSIPLRVTHNDTKINNVLIDPLTGKGVCVIDLDTVMPGSLLYDFGDGLRTGGATADEDERDLTKPGISLPLFKSYTEGYLAGMGDSITEKEKELMPYSVFLLTYECGIRFLTDYLDGDVYFKVHRPGHNLDRARAQFAMCRDILNKLPEMKKIVAEASAKH